MHGTTQVRKTVELPPDRGPVLTGLRRIAQYLAMYVRSVRFSITDPAAVVSRDPGAEIMAPWSAAMVSATILYCAVVALLGDNPFSAYELPVPSRLRSFLDVVPLGPIGVPLMIVILSICGSLFVYVGLRVVNRKVAVSTLLDYSAVAFAGPQTIIFLALGFTAVLSPSGHPYVVGGIFLAVIAWTMFKYFPAVSRESGAGFKRMGAALLVAGILQNAVMVALPSWIKTFEVVSSSMHPTVEPGHRVIANTSVFVWRSPRLNEVVTYEPPYESGMMILSRISRIVGLPGDTLQMIDRTLYRNGARSEELFSLPTDNEDAQHPWMRWQLNFLVGGIDVTRYQPTRDSWGPVRVPADHYFVMGDKRDNSFDSRYWGFLPGQNIQGSIFFVYWPLSRAGSIGLN